VAYVLALVLVKFTTDHDLPATGVNSFLAPALSFVLPGHIDDYANVYRTRDSCNPSGFGAFAQDERKTNSLGILRGAGRCRGGKEVSSFSYTFFVRCSNRLQARAAGYFVPAAANIWFYSSARMRMAVKTRDEYRDVQTLPSALLAREGPVGPTRPGAVAGPKAIAGRMSTCHISVLVACSFMLSSSTKAYPKWPVDPRPSPFLLNSYSIVRAHHLSPTRVTPHWLTISSHHRAGET
jgi:hypothetical protein